MNFLLDTNVLIAAYPIDPESVEPTSGAASELIRIANEQGHTTYAHPLTFKHDIAHISDPEARQWRQTLLEKHPELPSPPPIQPSLSDELGNPEQGSNDWVDHHLLAAVAGDAVNVLVTEDAPLRGKGRRVRLGERVVDIDDAIATIRGLVPRPSNPMLLAEQVHAHELDASDPIFDSLRRDYSDFDSWLVKCKREHRTSWIVKDGNAVAAATIVKDETPAEFEIPGKTLKISLFKVSDSYPGMRYGELLLKSIFDFAFTNSYKSCYVTVLPKPSNDRVVEFFEKFGFYPIQECTRLGEIVLVKSLMPRRHADLDPLAFHVRYGPNHYSTDAPGFIVPIEPRYHRILFPELESQTQFAPMREVHAFGNSILKAYLSSGSSRSITPGSILYFYRSQDRRALTVVGIAEGTLLSRSPDVIAGYVGKRTVYSYAEIESLATREVLAILFRQARVIDEPVSDKLLQRLGVWQRPPQSIMGISEEAVASIQRQIDK